MNYNSTYAMAAICGDVTIMPERQVYGENNKELVKFTLSITQPGYNGAPPTYMPFQVVCFGKAAELALTIQRGQRALVTCDLKNKQKENNGYVFDNISVTARHILAFPMPQQQNQQQGGAQQETRQQPSQQTQPPHQPRILQQQGLTPQQDVMNRLHQQGAESNADIPF